MAGLRGHWLGISHGCNGSEAWCEATHDRTASPSPCTNGCPLSSPRLRLQARCGQSLGWPRKLRRDRPPAPVVCVAAGFLDPHSFPHYWDRCFHSHFHSRAWLAIWLDCQTEDNARWLCSGPSSSGRLPLRARRLALFLRQQMTNSPARLVER